MSTLHRIEAKQLEPRFARGWHCLGLSSQYRDGKPHRAPKSTKWRKSLALLRRNVSFGNKGGGAYREPEST